MVCRPVPPTTAVTLAEQINLIAVGIICTSVFISIWSLRLCYAERDAASPQTDRCALGGPTLLYLVMNAAMRAFDLSGPPN